MWEQPFKCAKLVDRLTSQNIEDSKHLNLNEYTRKDLEGIIHLLHGYYTQFVHDHNEFREILHCNYVEVLEAMSLAESLYIDENGEPNIDEASWNRIKDNPHITQFLLQLYK